MSLINKMLQDLDARGTPGAESFPTQIRPVAPARAGLLDRVDARTLSIGVAGTAAVCVAAVLAWYGWGKLHAGGEAAKPAAAAAKQAQPAPAAQPAMGMSSTITMGPADAPTPVPAAAPVKPATADDSFDAPDEARRAGKPAKPAGPAPKSVAGYEPDSDEARAARQAIMAELQARMANGAAKPAASRHASKAEAKAEAKRRKLAKARERKAGQGAHAAASAVAPAPAAKGKRGVQGREESVSQRAEGEYRRALGYLQDGRMNDSVASLEQALKLDPAHDAARQTLVGLLIEAKHTDEAIRHLQTGLAVDPRQPALAMLLARLQIERGGPAIDTLLRTLPYAGNNADYHAFLAGALQREQRNREAAEQYQAALRVAPANGVWWMGLGMSLQAEKRNSEALEAFQRARASGTLSAELQAFVERRLQQLSR